MSYPPPDPYSPGFNTGGGSHTWQAIVLMGVSGCGKTTVGRLLSHQLGWLFIESDDYHSNSDVQKMSNGIPLTDDDRWPWLDRLHQLLHEHCQRGQSLIMACSALKQVYRDRLAHDLPAVTFVLLLGDESLISERMRRRSGHFMKAGMLRSQLDILEPPHGSLIISIDQPPEHIVAAICQALSLS